MNQDEAWKAHVEEYDRDRFDSTSRHRRHCFDAGWDAALADTVGLLEWLMKYGDIYIEWAEPKTLLGHSLVVLRKDFEGNTGPFFYHKYFRKGEPIPERDPLSRDEVLTLLEGKEEKG